MTRTPGQSRLIPYTAKIAAFAFVCFWVARLGLLFSLDASGVSLVWPLTGVSLAAFLVFGRRLWPGLWVALLLNELVSGISLPLSFVVACGSTAMALFGAYTLETQARFDPSFLRVRDVLAFVGYGVLLSPVISALVGAFSFTLAGLAAPADLAQTLFTWWVGDAMGVLVIAPMLLIWGKVPFARLNRRRSIEAAGSIVLLTLSGWVIFNQGFMPRSFYPLAYLIFPILIWGALRFGQRMVATLTLIVSLLVVVTTAEQLADLRGTMVWNTVLFLWAYVATMTITSMLLAATLAERRSIERTALGLEERFAKAFRNAPVAIWITNVHEGRMIDVNDQFTATFGYTRAEALGRTSRDLNLWEYPEFRMELLEVYKHQGRLAQYQVNLCPKTGPMRSGLLSSEGIELDGEPRLLNMFHDITERVETEEALRDSESRYRELFEGVDDAVFVHDTEANILAVNEATCRRLGYTREELLAMKVTDIDSPEHSAGFSERLQEQMARGSMFGIEGTQRTKDGREIYIDVNTKLITYQGKPAILAVVRDITERKLSEQKLRESEARYRAVVEDQTEFIARVAPDWQLKFCNLAYQRYYGKTAEELNGSYFKPQVYEDDYQLVRSALKSLSLENLLVTYEHRVRLPDGALRWQQWTVRAITDDAPQITEFQFVGKDITEVKEIEQQRLAAALEHEKVQILADFIAAASHDFRTPLSVINTSAYLLNRATDSDQRERHYQQITDQTYHIDKLVDGLLTMSRLDRGDVFHFRPVHVNGIVRQIEARKRTALEGKQLTLQLDLDPGLATIEADESWLYRGVVQFVDNAIHYTPEGGTITMRTAADSHCVSITISDTGIGISPGDLPHIFERLFRGEGHRPVGGQGLGLSIAAKIIEAHHGRIEVESQLGVGSTFRVLLPFTKSGMTVESFLPL